VARNAARRRLLHLRRASGCLDTSCGSSSTTSPTPHVRVPQQVARLVAQARRRLLRLSRTSGCLGTSRGSSCRSSLTTSSPPRVRVPRHVARLVAQAHRRLLHLRRASGCFSTSRARHVARHTAHRGLLRLRRLSGCLDTSRGSSRGSSSTTSTRAGSSSTALPTPHVQVPQHVARLVSPLTVDYFAYVARPGASARRAARLAARRRLLRRRRTSVCLGTSRGSARRLVIDYITSATRPVASARRAACHVTHSRLLRIAQAVRRLLCLSHASWCLSLSRDLSYDSSSTTSPRVGSSSHTSPTPRVRVPRHVTRLVAWLVTPLVVDYFASAARLGASACRAARRADSSLTTSPMSSVLLLRHVAQLVA
jgi:hypothetical protein